MDEALDAMSTGVWPENEKAATVFARVATQWRASMGGAHGLDYTPLFRLLDAMNLEPDEFLTVFDQVRVMEDSVLEMFALQRERAKHG